jgi:curved DNA-binding protein
MDYLIMMNAEFKDYYATLGVAHDATAQEIKQAYRRLARKHHPDVAKNKSSSDERFKDINEANEVLSDPDKRQTYDQLCRDRYKHTEGAASGRGGDRGDREFHFGGTGFSEFFEQYFSGGTRYGFPQDVDEGFYQTHFADTGGIRPKRGSDIEGEFLITLEEAMHGTVRPISLQIFNRQTGKTETQSFKIRIPSGAVDGRRIRVPGHGEPGYGGGRAGDLFLRLRHAVHPDFTSRDADIFHELDIAPWEAVLGAELSVPTLDGSIKLRVPVHSQHGQKLRVRGRGLPKGKSGTRGDCIVILTLQFPKTIGYDERVLWEKLRGASSFMRRPESPAESVTI